MPPMGLSKPLNVPQQFMPRHVAIIMDGNGRWARLRGRPRVFGHKSGAETVRKIVEQSGQWGLKVLTLYAFSDENWKRPAEEVGVIMNLLEHYLRKERDDLNRQNVQFRVIGDLSKLSPSLRKLILETRALLAENTGLILNVALSYGARAEITRAVSAIVARVKDGAISPDQIDQQMISSYLDTADLPDPDLIIRTSGEQRISNFLLWQSAYSEFYFTPVMWPDFTRDEFAKALEAYATRERRFGLTSAQIDAINPLASLTAEESGSC
jgi:undecaprenyl diphosphate synthase